MLFAGLPVQPRIDEIDVERYLARLGVEAEPPSVAALRRLHRAQVERVPYETTWIQLGEEWSVDPVASFQRIARLGRGGYCFHVNGAFAVLLEWLGYQVTLHRGGVHGPGGPDSAMLDNHLVLMVHGLPASECPDGTWYVDAGLGEGLHDPMPLIAGAATVGPPAMSLAALDPGGGAGDWHVAHDPLGAFTGMSFEHRAAPAIDVFAGCHEFLRTSPNSPFVRTVSVQRRHTLGVDTMRGCVLSRWRADGITEQIVDRRDDWFSLLHDEMNLRLDGVASDALTSAWRRIHATHISWLEERSETTAADR